VNLYRHALPVMGSYLPIPVSQASLNEMDGGDLKMIEFSDIPFLA
jgi:hypothetical protein